MGMPEYMGGNMFVEYGDAAKFTANKLNIIWISSAGRKNIPSVLIQSFCPQRGPFVVHYKSFYNPFGTAV